MKHVREDLPDIQRRRPEVSASLAAVLDRMTEKDLDRRYPDVDTLVSDLEDALAIETARTGTSTGEATAVLRTLPVRARRRLPLRVRFPVPLAAFLVVVLVGAGVLAFAVKEGADRTTRGTGPGRIKPSKGTQVVSLKRNAAHDYDPLSTDGEEHPEDAYLAIDRDPKTAWSTESYTSGMITKVDTSSPPGVGLYVDARPGVNAVQMTVQTPKPGWAATIYGAPAGGGAPAGIGSKRWTKLAAGTVKSKETRFKLDTGGQSYRYYLVWITKLPPHETTAEIAEIFLSAPKP
jgi:serine/threonine-protein kinase